MPVLVMGQLIQARWDLWLLCNGFELIVATNVDASIKKCESEAYLADKHLLAATYSMMHLQAIATV